MQLRGVFSEFLLAQPEGGSRLANMTRLPQTDQKSTIPHTDQKSTKLKTGCGSTLLGCQRCSATAVY